MRDGYVNAIIQYARGLVILENQVGMTLTDSSPKEDILMCTRVHAAPHYGRAALLVELVPTADFSVALVEQIIRCHGLGATALQGRQEPKIATAERGSKTPGFKAWVFIPGERVYR